MKKILLFIAVFLFSTSLFAQEEASEVRELQTIFNSLEYNTIAFDDLKRKWIINDPALVRDVYSRFIVNDVLRLDGQKVSSDVVKERSELVFDGEVYLDLRQRYFDDQIEHFAFLPASEVGKENPVYLFDPIDDGFYLRNIVGAKLYQKLKSQEYYFSNITKEEYDVKPGYYFDIDLNLFDPKVTFWTTTSEYRNKYLLSFFGQWGNDKFFLPGWFAPEMYTGLNLTFYDYLTSDPRKYTYSVSVGTGLTTGHTFTSDLPPGRIDKSADNLYAKLSGDIGKFIFDDFEDLYLDIEVCMTYSDYRVADINPVRKYEFYAIRDFFTISATKRNLFNLYDLGMFEAGLGIATHSVHHFEVDPAQTKLTQLDNKDYMDRFNHFVVASAGINRTGGLIQHNLTTMLGYDVTNGIGYVGANLEVMLSDTFGMMMKFYSGFGVDTSTP
ncbi:MAG: hypothetical protein K9H06_03510, partial [Melioribacteraceae bacterium]|nr:hypothetical protein [Melioribacteraceae bacterium]